MQFSREVKHILFGLLIAFGLVAITSAYWAVAGPATISTRDDNPRLIEDILRIQRGGIYDRDNQLLVETITNDNQTIRNYLYESTYSPIGYYSVRYGESGVESAFNEFLSGITEINSLETYFERHVIKIPPIGADVQLTLDLAIQDSLFQAISGSRGAGVVINTQNGNILALASLPTFNPNTLDDEWDTLTETEGNPFFNRVLQGQYQPGSLMYTLWMSQAFLTRYNTSTISSNTTDEVELGNNTIVTCVIEPSQDDLSLTQAYQFGCPSSFVSYSRTSNYTELLETFALDNQITLADFPIPEPITPTSGTQTTVNIDPDLQALRDTLGQGNITVTPLHIAGMMSAIANNGNAPIPQIQKGIRYPKTSDWQPVQANTVSSVPMMTTATARQLRTLMQTNWQTIQADTYNNGIVVGANIATSLSGDETQLWLVGFIRTEQAGHVAFVVLLEDTNDVQHIISIGQTLIQDVINELLSVSSS